MINMHYVYIIKSKKNKNLYIGCTGNLSKRLQGHNNRKVKSTKAYVPWQLVYYEAYLSGKEAFHREKNLKFRSNAWIQLKRRIRDSIKKAD